MLDDESSEGEKPKFIEYGKKTKSMKELEKERIEGKKER